MNIRTTDIGTAIDADVTRVRQSLERSVNSGLFTGEAQKTLDRSLAVARKIERLGLPIVEKSAQNRLVETYKHKAYVPLVWSEKLPTKQRKGECRVYCSKTTDFYKVHSLIPLPPKEAVDDYTRLKEEFDHCELWWVPRDIEFATTPDPDPIIVGALKNGKKVIYLEIYRWIDETVEDPLYNAIAY